MITINTIQAIPCYILVISMLTCCGSPSEQNTKQEGLRETNGKETIVAYENKLITAFKSNDLVIIESLYHDSLLFNTPNGQTITKAMDLENMRSGLMAVIEYTPSDQTIAIAEGVAVVAVTIHLKAKVAGNPIDGNFRFLRVWKLSDDSWKVIAVSGFQI